MVDRKPREKKKKGETINTGKMQKGETRNPRGRPKGPIPRIALRNEITRAITEQDHETFLSILRAAAIHENMSIRLEAAKHWFSSFPLNQIRLVPQRKFKSQQDVMEYSAEYIHELLSTVTLDPEKLMNILERHSGFIRAAQIEKAILEDNSDTIDLR